MDDLLSEFQGLLVGFAIGDTTGAVYGQIAGAYYGIKNIKKARNRGRI